MNTAIQSPMGDGRQNIDVSGLHAWELRCTALTPGRMIVRMYCMLYKTHKPIMYSKAGNRFEWDIVKGWYRTEVYSEKLVL